MPKFNLMALALIIILVGGSSWLLYQIINFGANQPEVQILDVGQGDSSLIILPTNIKILIDGGNPSSVLNELDKALGGSRYIDLIVMSHPQLDHFGGLIDVLRKYEVGAFL